MAISVEEFQDGTCQLDHLQKEVTEVNKLISEYEVKKPTRCDVEMKILLKDYTPIYQRARRLAFAEKEELE